MRTILPYILITNVVIMVTIVLQIFFQVMVGLEVFDFQNYSWWEWLLQILYWILSISAGLMISIESEN